MAAATLVIAHRGASHVAPENTLPAIERAVAEGVEMIYLEVQGTQDQEPVMLADTRLDRTTDATGRVNQKTLAQVRELDAGSWFGPAFAGTPIPTLAEALAAVGTKARLALVLPELREAPALTERIRAALTTRTVPAQDVLFFHDSDSLRSFREAAPGFGYALAPGEKVEAWVAVEKAARLGLKVVRPYRNQTTPQLVRQAHGKGLQVLVYFADEETEMRELLAARVDGIVTSRPERLKGLLRE